jgi:hypothetical protein
LRWCINGAAKKRIRRLWNSELQSMTYVPFR